MSGNFIILIKLCSVSLLLVFIINTFFISIQRNLINNSKSYDGTHQCKLNDEVIKRENLTEDYWTTTNKCKLLRHFTARDVTSCIEYLHENSPSQSWLHFAFIGDSRIRQHFYNLLKV